MALPARAKKQAETVSSLAATATAAEAKTAAQAMHAIADDPEVPLDLRGRASQFAADLAASPTSESMVRREGVLAAARSWSGMNI